MHHPTDRIAHTTAWCGELAGTRNSSMGPPWMIDPTTHQTMSESSYHGAAYRSVGEQMKKEGNVLFNDTLNTFYLRLYGIRHMEKDHSYCERGTHCRLHGLYFPISCKGSFISHRQYSTYHSLCYTSCGANVGMIYSSMGLPWRIDLTTHDTISKSSYHGATSRSFGEQICYMLTY